MKMVKSLLLGSAAGIAAVAGAQAADLPVKAKPVEYVKVCSLYGAGYYYIPGTETCIRIGGFLRYNLGIGSVAAFNPDDTGAGPYRQRDRDFFNSNARFASQIDVRSNTDYGVLRTYGYAYFNAGSYAATSVTVLTAYSQLAGFTVGKFKGSFYAPWSSSGSGNLGIYRPTDSSAEAGVEYKWNLGGGLSAAIGVFDPRRSGIFDRADTMSIGAYAQSQPQLGVSNSGYHMPDIAGNVRIEQAWGGLHVGARAHEVMATYNGAVETTGAPTTKYGYAVNASLNLKNLPTGTADQLWAAVGYAKGSMNSLFATTPLTSFAFFGPGRGAAYNTVAFGYLLDATFDSSLLPANGAPIGFGGGALQLTEGWTATLAYEHWWLPAKLKSTFYGNYAEVNYNEAAKASICTGAAGASRFSFTAGSVCDPNWSYLTLGSSSTWYPARDFEISIDVAWSRYDTASSGSMAFAAAAAPLPAGKPAGLYEIQDQSHVYSTVNILRTW